MASVAVSNGHRKVPVFYLTSIIHDMKRLVVFIDNSNVFKSLADLKKVDDSWCKSYDPKHLAENLAGNRELIKTIFYCAPPPGALQRSNPGAYSKQLAYYDAVKKLEGVELKLATLTMNDGKYFEKNLDTQLTADLITMAARGDYEVAIIVSNDGDFVSGAEAAKALGKKIEIGYFKGRVSMDLKRVSDVSRRLRQSYFVSVFGNDKTA